MKIILITLALLFAVGGFFAWKIYQTGSMADGNKIFCTQEAKQCPDGSYVGRTGPNCEFVACPSLKSDFKQDISTWKTYRNEKYGFEVKYPPGWNLKEKTNVYTISKDKIKLSIFPEGFHVGDMEKPICTIKKISLDNKIAEESVCKFGTDPFRDPNSDPNRVLIEIRFDPPITERPNFVFLHETSNQDLLSEFDQILSTFKFIEPAKEVIKKIPLPPPPPPISACGLKINVSGETFTPNFCDYESVIPGVPCGENTACKADLVIAIKDLTYPKDRMYEMVFYNILGSTSGVYKYNANNQDFKGYLFQGGGLSRNLIEAELRIEAMPNNMVYVTFTSEFAGNIKISGAGLIPVNNYSAP